MGVDVVSDLIEVFILFLLSHPTVVTMSANFQLKYITLSLCLQNNTIA